MGGKSIYEEAKFLLGCEKVINFAQRSVFPGLRYFNDPENFRFGSHSSKYCPEDSCSVLLHPEKAH